MTAAPGLSLRAALAQLAGTDPAAALERPEPIAAEAVARDFADRYAGVPAVGIARSEPAVRYTRVGEEGATVLLGLYGDQSRLAAWLPGLPERTTPQTAARLLAAARAPRLRTAAPCRQLVARHEEVDLTRLPVLTATPRDAGPYLTAALVHAEDPVTGESALSAHRMLVLDRRRLTIWLVPGRQLGLLHLRALERGERLAVTVNIGVPPAAMLASALNSRFLPPGLGKLALAGALAGQPLGLAPALTQPAHALAEAEIVLEGHLDDSTAAEALDEREPGCSLPEFLGYDGRARTGLPVLTVTAVTTRRNPLYQAVIGPGREQSHILGVAGAFSVALSLPATPGLRVADLYFSPAGGGMLLLAVAVRKEHCAADGLLAPLAREVFRQHPFVKTVVFTDDDVAIRCAEDLLWAMTTRCNLAADAACFEGFPPVPMDPAQTPEWAGARHHPTVPGRVAIDATTPYALRASTARSFLRTGVPVHHGTAKG
ncbi:UbiD family decarboxylase [Kitasatospora kifunensis]|uniref:4-hydroxy-3-polyprenylbenzoate decarboxylase n=1 Tax=Kitasatospora kifunensis TaxID=58351 RepID=A0A7W7VT06_KITKI|nr:UbiD family decarboxylase [Kitasatospora kifunensis]MBB4921194.1 4-hydroxy-3-polyprenylbenzoate decarboxylase [Kitasatospora kifunensis]